MAMGYRWKDVPGMLAPVPGERLGRVAGVLLHLPAAREMMAGEVARRR